MDLDLSIIPVKCSCGQAGIVKESQSQETFWCSACREALVASGELKPAGLEELKAKVKEKKTKEGGGATKRFTSRRSEALAHAGTPATTGSGRVINWARDQTHRIKKHGSGVYKAISEVHRPPVMPETEDQGRDLFVENDVHAVGFMHQLVATLLLLFSAVMLGFPDRVSGLELPFFTHPAVLTVTGFLLYWIGYELRKYRSRSRYLVVGLAGAFFVAAVGELIFVGNDVSMGFAVATFAWLPSVAMLLFAKRSEALFIPGYLKRHGNEELEFPYWRSSFVRYPVFATLAIGAIGGMIVFVPTLIEAAGGGDNLVAPFVLAGFLGILCVLFAYWSARG